MEFDLQRIWSKKFDLREPFKKSKKFDLKLDLQINFFLTMKKMKTFNLD